MNNRTNTIIAGVLALFLAIGGAYFVRERYLSSLTVVQVPVPIRSIATGTLLTTDMFQMKEFPSALVDVGGGGVYATSPDQFANMVTRGELPAGLPVPVSVLTNYEAYRPGADGEVLVSIPVSAVDSVGGIIRSGDFVDIYRLYSEPAPQKDEIQKTDYQLAQSERIATVLVVYTLDKNGNPSGRAAQTSTSSGNEIIRTSSSSSGPNPTEILVISAPRQVAEKIMRLQAAKNEVMWLTLAENQQD